MAPYLHLIKIKIQGNNIALCVHSEMLHFPLLPRRRSNIFGTKIQAQHSARSKAYAPERDSIHNFGQVAIIMIDANSKSNETGENTSDKEIADLQQEYATKHNPEIINRAVKRWYGI
ncbi:MAG: hypothetical protein HC843_04350 [Sphingomonadales bacterium]|nr:hypothetical protein [Sphingomonadales bacterium]